MTTKVIKESINTIRNFSEEETKTYNIQISYKVDTSHLTEISDLTKIKNILS